MGVWAGGDLGNGWSFGVCGQVDVHEEGRKAEFVMYKD